MESNFGRRLRIQKLPFFEKVKKPVSLAGWRKRQALYLKNSQQPLTELAEYISEGEAFLKFHKAKGLILDLGCGNGYYAGVPRKESGFTYVTGNVIGVDPIKGINKPPFVQAVAECLPFKAGTFNHVVSATAYDHFIDAEKATREVSRVLRDKGDLSIWTQIRSNLKEHTYSFTMEDLENLFREFDIEAVEHRKFKAVFMKMRK